MLIAPFRTMTLQDALESDIAPGHYVYRYRDGREILYVGKSRYPDERLLEHLGISERHLFACDLEPAKQGMLSDLDFRPLLADWIGEVIADNRPRSWAWSLDYIHLKDLYPQAYSQREKHPALLDTLLSHAETECIRYYSPYCNIMHKRPGHPLPERYIKRKVANRGVKLGE